MHEKVDFIAAPAHKTPAQCRKSLAEIKRQSQTNQAVYVRKEEAFEKQALKASLTDIFAGRKQYIRPKTPPPPPPDVTLKSGEPAKAGACINDFPKTAAARPQKLNSTSKTFDITYDLRNALAERRSKIAGGDSFRCTTEKESVLNNSESIDPTSTGVGNFDNPTTHEKPSHNENDYSNLTLLTRQSIDQTLKEENSEPTKDVSADQLECVTACQTDTVKKPIESDKTENQESKTSNHRFSNYELARSLFDSRSNLCKIGQINAKNVAAVNECGKIFS